MTKMTKEEARAFDIEALEEEERAEEGLPAFKPKADGTDERKHPSTSNNTPGADKD
jgi:hypothetical protein